MCERQEKKLHLNKYKADLQSVCWQPCNTVWQTDTNLDKKSVRLAWKDGYRWKWLCGGAQPASDRVAFLRRSKPGNKTMGPKFYFASKHVMIFSHLHPTILMRDSNLWHASFSKRRGVANWIPNPLILIFSLKWQQVWFVIFASPAALCGAVKLEHRVGCCCSHSTGVVSKGSA